MNSRIYHSSQRGSISIFAVIIFPFIILGLFSIYHLLNKAHTDNLVLKTTMMYSEVQLSKYNQYLFETYGLMTYIDDGTLESVLKQKLDKEPVTVTSQSIADLNHLKTTLLNSSYTILANIGKQTLMDWNRSEPEVNTPKNNDDHDSVDVSEPSSPSIIKQLIELMKRLERLKKEEKTLEYGRLKVFDKPWKDLPMLKPVTALEHLKISEYTLQVFKSYDTNCPRVTKLFTNRAERKHNLNGEVEYLLFGKHNDKENVLFMKLALFGMREVANLASIAKDNTKLSMITNITVAVPQPWGAVAMGLIVSLWTGAESYIDVQRLYAGEGFNPIKPSNEWVLSIDNLMDGNWQYDPSKTHTNGFLTSDWYYADYLRLMLNTMPSETMLKRILSLLEANLSLQTQGQFKIEQFSIGHTINIQLDKDNDLRFVNGYTDEK